MPVKFSVDENGDVTSDRPYTTLQDNKVSAGALGVFLTESSALLEQFSKASSYKTNTLFGRNQGKSQMLQDWQKIVQAKEIMK
jgi:hypothetical protein